MTNQTTPLERLNELERLVTILQNKTNGVESEEIYPKRLYNLPIWKGGEHLLLRCYKRTLLFFLSIWPVELQSDSKGQGKSP